jgi:prolyl-tRNA synthetase
LSNKLGGGALRPATDEEITAVGAAPGYASPIGLTTAAGLDQSGAIVIADESLTAGGNFVVGANEAGYHYSGANYPRDFAVTLTADIGQADSGHGCVQCGGQLLAQRAIEAGHCFKLGTRYSAAVGATYLDENGRPQPIYMGSYGIGLDRLMAIIVEQYHDADGIVWPAAVAPHQLHLLSLGKGEEVRAAAERLYDDLRAAGWDLLYDDRDISAGVKFKDADLIGVPLRVTVSARGLAENSAELKWRHQSERFALPLSQLADYLTAHWPPTL